MSLEKQLNLEIFKHAKIYLVSSQEFSDYKTLHIIEEALKAGLKLFQMREKTMPYSEKIILGKQLKELSNKYNAVFIVNDDVELAKTIDADGVHLGQEDMNIVEARKILGNNKIIGLSTHNYKEAMNAKKQDIDYINIGPVNITNTKQHLVPVSVKEIEKIINNINIPFTFMGGIKEDNILEFYKFKPSAFAMVTEITKAKNIQNKVSNLFNVLK